MARSHARMRADAPPLKLPPGAMVLRLADARRRADARSRGRIRHRVVDLRAGDLRHPGALRRRRRRARTRPRDSGKSSPDATVFTFHLRHDARFTQRPTGDQRRFTYAIERVLRSRHALQGHGVLPRHRRRRRFHRGIAPDTSSGIETPDPGRSFSISTRPIRSSSRSSRCRLRPRCRARWRRNGARIFRVTSVGSGAFMLKEWIGGQRLVLVRNPYYFGKGLPQLDAVVDRWASARSWNGCKYEAGEIDVSDRYPAGRVSVRHEDSARCAT